MGSGVSSNNRGAPTAISNMTTLVDNHPPEIGELLRKASTMFSITRRTTSVRQGGGSYKNGNMQEEANSFKSKAGTLKMLVKNQNSRKAFFTFLEKTHNGKEELLDYFLFIESIKRVRDNDQSRNQFLEVVKKYEKESDGKESEANAAIIFSSTHTWKDIKSLPTDELRKHMIRSQDEVMLHLTPLFESFMDSKFYLEVNRSEMAHERRSYGSAVILE